MTQRISCLFVAEKPSIARTLSEVLSRGQARHRSTCARTNPCYDFDLDIDVPIFTGNNNARNLRVTVTSVRGHLMTMDFSDKSTKNWRTTAHRQLFEANIERSVTLGLEDVAQNIRNEAAKVKVLVIWTDCDREGEAIGEEILRQSISVNSRIICKRARFSTANAPDLWRAVNTLRELNQREIDAVLARQEIDLRLGAVFTRFQTISLQDKVDALTSKIVSFGPCQFPTLGFIVARYEAILAFEKESFWQIQMSHASTTSQNDSNGQRQQLFHFTWGRHRLFDRTLALVAYEMCVQHPQATVTEVSRKPTFKRRPIPLSTVELQVRASRWLKLDSETVMKAAESLYQRGIISYPRTETESFSDTFDLRSIIGEFRNSPEYGQFATQLLDGDGFETPRKGAKNDEAHPPIHPTKWVNNLTELPEVRVYELVCRHFLACCSKDAVGSESVVKVKVAAETFTAKGLIVHERNFLDVYIFEKWGEKSIPDFQEGDTFVPTKMELVSGETTPPELLSEADLIRLMDKNGIGTDATIQDHIKTVLEREYASKLPEKQNRFAPSNLGVALVRAYNRMGHELAISRPELRSEMERDLMKICRGEKNKDEVIRSTIEKYREVFLDVLSKRNILLQFVESVFFGGDIEGNVAPRFETRLASSFSKCGGCGERSMELLQNSQENRLGLRCANPACAQHDRILQPLPSQPGSQLVPRQDEFTCPLCRYQVITMSAGERSWQFCPSCLVQPPAEAAGDMEDLATMPCFKCSKSDCQLSGNVPEDPIMPCPDCRTNSLVLRKKNGDTASVQSFYLSCKGYPTCKGYGRLPKCCKEVSLAPEDARCSGCGSRKLHFKFERNKVPPGTPMTMIECANFRSCQKHSSDFDMILEMENLRSGAMLSAPSVSTNFPRGPSHVSSSTVAGGGRVVGSGFASGQSRSVVAAPQARNNGLGAPRPVSSNTASVQPQSRVAPSVTTTTAASNQQMRSGGMSSTSSGPAMGGGFQPASRFIASSSSSSGNTMSQRVTSSGGVTTRECSKCRQPLIERVSNSANNPGRAFYKCDPCNVFEWADANGQSSGSVSSQVVAGNRGNAASSSSFPSYPQSQSVQVHPPRAAVPTAACYHCGSFDHFPVQCPSVNPGQPPAGRSSSFSNASTTSGSRPSDVCFKCNQPGHWSSQCPNNGFGGSGVRGNSLFQSRTQQPPPRGSSAMGNSKYSQSQKRLRRCRECQSEIAPRKRICEQCGCKN